VKRSLVAAALALAGCGYVGPPLPPTLDIPQRVTDLAVAEYGDQIHVQFTIPPLTMEGLPLTSVRSVEMRVGPPTASWNQDAWAASAKSVQVTATGPGAVSSDTPATEWIGKEVVIAVRLTGPKGKTSDWSNLRTLPIRPPLAAPVDGKAENQPNAIIVTWRGSAGHYRIFRASGDVRPELLGESDSPEYRDTDVEYGTRYRYLVQATEGELQQSEMAGPFEVTAEDKFPPSTPAGLAAEPGTNSIELSWERNTEPRFQGYNVYRAVEGGPLEKIASLIASPSYTDRQVEAGKSYRYQVTSVGTNSLESARSVEVAVTVH
jgi:fibronectin type 3 domain-containing protein